MSEVVILAAGRSSRLGGRSKLLVDAAGIPVHEWHRRAIGARAATAVVRSDDAAAVADAAPWLALVTHDSLDGPAGAVLAYLRARAGIGGVTVLFGDTLLPAVPERRGCWVGVAPAPWRVWDYPMAGRWVRGVPEVPVCIGLYHFCAPALLAAACERALATADGEASMADVLNEYATHQWLEPLPIEGWQDAGDPDALRRVVA